MKFSFSAKSYHKGAAEEAPQGVVRGRLMVIIMVNLGVSQGEKPTYEATVLSSV